MQKDETKQLHKTTKAKQYAVKQPMAYWYSQRGSKKISRNKMKTWWTKTYGIHQTCSNREVYSNTRKIPNKQSNVTPKAKKEQTKSKGSRRKEIIKIRAGINEIPTEKITKTKIWFFEKIKLINLQLWPAH